MKRVNEYLEMLKQEERSSSTQAQYQRSVERFLSYAGGRELDKELVVAYKEELAREFSPSTVNGALAALNGYFKFLGRDDLRVRRLKMQHNSYCTQERELNREEYLALVQAAKDRGNEKLYLILQTICGTGIRVSELKFITAEAVAAGAARVRMKGKNRVILLPERLEVLLADYARRQEITSGPIFITKYGNPMDRSNIWQMLRSLCADAGVEPQKVFPHNLRHLFARCFYAEDKDLSKLADVLGHSNINTTRIYIISSGKEHRACMDKLGLVV